MIRITPEHIYVLRNSTGKPFTDLLDRLIRSSAATLGILSSAILDNPRTNHPDGGVDTQVTLAAQSDSSNHFNGKTAWQYKAVSISGFSASKIKEEITGDSKDYIRELLMDGYAYRMCIADDGPAEKKVEIKELLDGAIKDVNPSAPECIVLFASDIVAWVNMFPAIAAEMVGSTMTDFFHFRTWENQARAMTQVFVPTPQSSVIYQRVQNHIDWTHKPTSARLTVSGDAGVGKTRTVFEAIAALPHVSGLVLYTNDEDKAFELARAVANQQNLYAVIVADECLDATAFQLAKLLHGVEHRVRLITIDNALEQLDKSDLRLDRISLETLEKILEANFPNIDQHRRFRYCRLADGYLRFAVSLCVNDDIIVQQGHLGESLKDAKGYLGTLFGQDGPFNTADQTALNVIALVERCGIVGKVAAELEQLCALTHLDPNDVRERLHLMQKSNGLVGRAGRYFYVTPTPIAMVCFQAAWSRWAELDPKSFLEKFPRDLIPSFLARLSRASEEVGKVVTDYFRNWVLSRRGDIFTNEADTEQLLFLVRSDPERMVPQLHGLVLGATPQQLGHGYGSGRRALIVEASEIAAFPQWFKYAEKILFTLASHETEPDLGNNATKVWSGLFPIMSYVATPFDERLKIIQERGMSGDPATKIRCLEALQSALEDRTIHMMGSQTFGNRIAPTPWRPKTYGELYGYMKACLSELRILSSDSNDTVREKATEELIQSIRSLVFRGFLQQAKEGAGDLPSHVRPVLRAELREFLLLNNSEHSPHSEEEKKRRAQFVDEWVNELVSTDIHDRLIEDVGPDSWDHHLEQAEWEGRIRGLASYLMQNDNEFTKELPWLNSAKARSSAEFGIQLGRIDESLKFLDQIVALCRENRNPSLTRGYFAGVSETARPKLPSEAAAIVNKRLNASMDELWDLDPVLGFNVMTLSGDFVRSFARTISGVREKKIPSRFLHTFVAWNGPRRTSSAEARLAAQTLLDVAREGDEDAANTGIEFIVFLLMRADDLEDKLVWLQTIFNDKSLDVIFSLLEQVTLKARRPAHSFSEIFIRVLPANPERATSILLQLMQSESYEASEAAAGLFASVATIRPQELMEGIGEILLEKERRFNFLFRKLPIISLPEDVVIGWLEKHGLEGARVLARHAPGPFISKDGPDLNRITLFILEKYGNDDDVFSAWFSGMHGGQAFAGSIADHMEHRAEQAEPFLTFPIEAVRRWARAEISFANENVENLRLTEEERF
jgi:hypothetical protein